MVTWANCDSDSTQQDTNKTKKSMTKEPLMYGSPNYRWKQPFGNATSSDTPPLKKNDLFGLNIPQSNNKNNINKQQTNKTNLYDTTNNAKTNYFFTWILKYGGGGNQSPEPAQ